MLTAALALIVLHRVRPSAAQSVTPASWYGPVTATFNVDFTGNPYDPDQNDVRVEFVGAKGAPIERLAYYDGQGAWKAVLVAPEPGPYHAMLVRNGRKAQEPAAEGVLNADTPLKLGYLRPDPLYPNRFRRDTGEPYYPVGFDMAWQNGGQIPLKDQLVKMGQAGVNWTRIWANHWDGKNPWWPPTAADSALPGQLWAPALDTWQDLIQACETNGVSFQMTLFHHGPFSTHVDANWPDSPWNAKNGGFLKDPADFFTDPEAKRRTKMWLRYAVARYAASPYLMAWELFNEVQWVDARYADRWKEIEAWHAEMADYLRQIDPYHHMVTTSSEMSRPDLWKRMDYVQPHTYPNNVFPAIYGATMPTDKPGFFGEFGPSDPKRADLREVVRDGIYAAMLANHAGAAMFWYWDLVDKENLYGEFATAVKVRDRSDLAAHGAGRRLTMRVQGAGPGDLRITPGGGFEKAVRTRLELPGDLRPDALAEVPTFLQGNVHRDMFPTPLTLHFRSERAGTVRVKLGNVAKAGATLHIRVNGHEAVTRAYPAADADHTGEPLEAAFPAGEVTLELVNDGVDWVVIDQIALLGAGADVDVAGLGEPEWMMLRLTQTTPAGHARPRNLTVLGVSLNDGEYEVTRIDLATGDVKTERQRVTGFQLRNVAMASADEMLIFHRPR